MDELDDEEPEGAQDDLDDEEDDKELLEGKADKAYQRVRVMIEGLLESGRRALESKPEDFVGTGKGGAKVLTAEEVRNWRGDDNETETFDDDDTESVASVPVGAMKGLNLKAPEEDKKLPPHACA